jgi:O-antigen ligase
MFADSPRRKELVLLGLLVLVLPSLEALKTTFWVLYTAYFVISRYRQRTLSLWPAKPANIALTAFLSVTLISTLVNWPLDNGFKGFWDEFRFCSLFLCLYNGGYSRQELRGIGMLAIVGVLGGLLYGMVEFLMQSVPALQFHSAGVLTQSSIYLGIAVVMTAGMLMDRSGSTAWQTWFLAISLALQLIALVYMGSRGSMLGVGMVFVLLALIGLRRRILLLALGGIAACVLLVGVMVQLFPDNVFSRDILRQYSLQRIQQADGQRVEAWRMAAAKLATGEDLLLGIGPRNYPAIYELPFVKQSTELQALSRYPHAHNLFLTHLIEQGIAGLLAMLSFMMLVLGRLYRGWRTAPANAPPWTWYAGLGGLAVPLLAGLFNTPFYQEHAMLAMIVIGMLYAGGHDHFKSPVAGR